MEVIGDTTFYQDISTLLENVKPEELLDKSSTVLNVAGVFNGIHTAFRALKLCSSLRDIKKSFESKIKKNGRLSGEADLHAVWESIVEDFKDDQVVMKLIEPVKEKISDTTTGTDVLEVLSNIEKTKTNNVIQQTGFQSIAVVLVQYVSLYSAWVFISRASNVVKNEEKFKKINESFAEINEKIEEVRNLMNTDPNNTAIERKVTRIGTLCLKTLALINEIEARIDGRMQKLYLYVDKAVNNMATNAVSIVTDCLQLYLNWDILKLETNFLGIGLAAFTSGAIAANAYVYYLSQKQLEELQQDQKDVIDLKKEFDKLQEEIDKIAEERDKD